LAADPLKRSQTPQRLVLGLALAAAAAGGAFAQNDKRFLLVLARRQGDPRIAAQKAEVAQLARAGEDRDLAVVVALADPELGRGRPFEVVLLGKDGGAKLRSDKVVTAGALAALIDAMPMGREELRSRGGRP
jgi:hypothetical protein